GLQLPGPVHDAAVGDPGGEPALAAVEVPPGQPFDLLEHRRVEHRAGRLADLLEARRPAGQQRPRLALPVDLRAAAGPAVQARDHPGALAPLRLPRLARA